ncbi:MAG: hypothetical protein ABEI96_03465 [Haloarculaceae archaeon]
MHRRHLLASLALSVPTLAGCSRPTARGDAAGTDDGTVDDTPTAGGGTVDDTPTTDDGTATDGGRSSRFAGEPCPSFVSNADRTVCYHDVDPEADEIVLSPSTELFEPTTGDDTVETVTFELHNGSERGVGLNPYAWRIERRGASGWEHVAPDAYIEPWYHVDPGQSYEWALSVAPHPAPKSERTIQITQDLTGGVYAFGVDGIVGAGADGEGGTRVEWVALFEVTRGEPVTVTSGEPATVTSGEPATVTSGGDETRTDSQ